MANEKKLDSVILGLLSHEELTGYEIKKRMDASLGYFWGASYGSIYPTLRALAEGGYTESCGVEEGVRAKQRFRITDKGREKLKEWLSEPAAKDEIRYETLLKIFFGSEGGTLNALRHIERFRMKTEQRLEELKLYERVLSEAPEEDFEDRSHMHYLMTVRFGVRTYEAYIAWCDEAELMLTGRENKL